MAKLVTTQLIDNSGIVLRAMHEQVEKAMKAIGAEAEDYAKKECPVDTGRLHNSIAWATSGGTGNKDEAKKAGDDKPKVKPENGTVYIGTNVEYAVYQEYGDYKHTSGKKHFLRDAMAKHGDHYKKILEAALKSGV